MYFSSCFLLIALAATPLVTAHGKVSVVKGDAGGNGTALGIIGGIVPGTGSNSVTEVDSTVFGRTNIATNGLGRTTRHGRNQAADLVKAMEQSGTTLPQVSPNGGSIKGTFHIVTTVSGMGEYLRMSAYQLGWCGTRPSDNRSDGVWSVLRWGKSQRRDR
jgi:hypothetical protein